MLPTPQEEFIILDVVQLSTVSPSCYNGVVISSVIITCPTSLHTTNLLCILPKTKQILAFLARYVFEVSQYPLALPVIRTVESFLVAGEQLYIYLCPSVCHSVAITQHRLGLGSWNLAWRMLVAVSLGRFFIFSNFHRFTPKYGKTWKTCLQPYLNIGWG